MPERLLHSVPEACELLGLSRDSVYRLIGKGELGSVKAQGRRLITARQLSEYVSRLERASEVDSL